MDKSNSQKGQASFFYVVMVVLMGIGVFFAVKHFKNSNNDIVIHVPKVEVH